MYLPLAKPMALSENHLSVRELQENDISCIADYWLNADRSFLKSMGVDISKLPREDEWSAMLKEQLSQSYRNKSSYCIVWLLNDEPIGHSNINKIVFGDEAFMHLHIWKPSERKKGLGPGFIRQSLPYFFKNYNLKKLFSEPYALNPAPNKALQKAGFKCIKSYITTPGWINFEQQVNLWQLTFEEYSTSSKSL
jgi:RimJ/RimL family protein N-acetyltransferase